MKKAVSYMLVGALTASAIILYTENKDVLNRKMARMKKDCNRTIHKVKAMF